MTIKDLSAQTGYSVGTISRVLNGHPNVSEKARAAILEAVRESGFELNANAKNLKQQHATSILVMVKALPGEKTPGYPVSGGQYRRFSDGFQPHRSALCAGYP